MLTRVYRYGLGAPHGGTPLRGGPRSSPRPSGPDGAASRSEEPQHHADDEAHEGRQRVPPRRGLGARPHARLRLDPPIHEDPVGRRVPDADARLVAPGLADLVRRVRLRGRRCGRCDENESEEGRAHGRARASAFSAGVIAPTSVTAAASAASIAAAVVFPRRIAETRTPKSTAPCAPR